MDSITHALYKAIAHEDRAQREAVKELGALVSEGVPGLQRLVDRPHRMPQLQLSCLKDMEPTDLHIVLFPRSETLLQFQLEAIAMGYTPPAGLYDTGADVFILPGSLSVFAPIDNGATYWWMELARRGTSNAGAERASWRELLVDVARGVKVA